MKLRVVLAAGGTGGHIFPAEALAETLLVQGYQVVLVTDARAGAYRGTLGNLERYMVRSGTFGRGLLKKLTAAGEIALGILQARKLLKQLAPNVVVGFGGYPSFPTMYAATGLALPTVIHEQNSVLGRANRLLAPRVQAVATSFPDTRFMEESYQSRVVLTGNPVRAAIRALQLIPYPTLPQDGHIRILVTGGSQGASIFSDVIPKAVGLLPATLRARVRIDQQCRETHLEETRRAYAAIGVSADLSSFFTDIPARLASAHLVIARAGASTVAELTAAGRPSLLVPLPNSMDNHQYHNANALEERGGGWMMLQEAFTPEALSNRIETFLTVPENLARAAECARMCGKIDAAAHMAELVRQVADTSISSLSREHAA